MSRKVPRWAVWVVALVIAAVLIPASFHVAARAAGAGRSVTRWDQSITVESNGRLTVNIDFDYDFGNNPGHGPTVSVVTRQRYDSDNDRIYKLRDVSATMDGTRVDSHMGYGRGATTIYLGSAAIDDVSGTHSYTLSYTIGPVLNPGPDDTVALYWNVMGTASTVPIDALTVRVLAAPEGTAAVRYACYAGDVGSTNSCTSATQDGEEAVFTQDHLAPHQPLTIDVLYPAASFPSAADPLLVRHGFSLSIPALSNLPAPTSLAGGMFYGGVLLALTGLWGGVTAVAHRRSWEYAGLPPGVLPDAATQPDVRRRRRRPAIAVRFDPPTDITPSEAGILQVGGYRPVDLAAAVVDLASRGYLTIDLVPATKPGQQASWMLSSTGRQTEALPSWERLVLQGIFGKAEKSQQPASVPLKKAVSQRPATWRRARLELQQAVRTSGWLLRDSQRAADRLRSFVWMAAALAVTVLLMGLIALGAGSGTGLIVLAVCIAVSVVALSRLGGSYVARSAEGSALNDQVDAYRLFMATADAETLRHADQDDPAGLFLRGLPWAMIFGLTRRWSALFGELGEAPAVPGAQSLASQAAGLAAFAAAAPALESALRPSGSAAPATPGGSGGSGFSSSSSGSDGGGSGGGGSAGGGGGGGGVGGW